MPAPTAFSQTLKIRRRRASDLSLHHTLLPPCLSLPIMDAKVRLILDLLCIFSRLLCFCLKMQPCTALFVWLQRICCLHPCISPTRPPHTCIHMLFSPRENTFLGPAFTSTFSPMLTINSPKDPSALCVSTTKTLFLRTQSQPKVLTSAISRPPPYLP